jgi:hypothetical protein
MGHYRRLLEPIGNVPPAEFESMFYRREDLLNRRTHRAESPMNPGPFKQASGAKVGLSGAQPVLDDEGHGITWRLT